jgi:hypothetical protein
LRSPARPPTRARRPPGGRRRAGRPRGSEPGRDRDGGDRGTRSDRTRSPLGLVSETKSSCVPVRPPVSVSQEGATDLPKALDRLVDVQTAANKRGEGKKWPDEWAKSPAAVAAAQPVT